MELRPAKSEIGGRRTSATYGQRKAKVKNWKHGTGGTTPKNSEKRNTTCPKKTRNLTSNWKMSAKVLFAVANKLYGITLSKLEDIPTYHPDVEVFEVKRRRWFPARYLLCRLLSTSWKKRRSMDEQLPRTKWANPSASMQCLQLLPNR